MLDLVCYAAIKLLCCNLHHNQPACGSLQVERSGKASFNGAQVGCIKSLSADNEAAAGEQTWKSLI